MTDQTKKEQQHSSGVDVFNMTSASQRAEGGQEAQPAATNASHGARSRRLPAIQARHFIALAFVAGSIWVAWPFIFGQSRAASVHGNSPRMLNPNQERSAAAPKPVAPNKIVEPSGIAQEAKSDTEPEMTNKELEPASLSHSAHAQAGIDADAKIDELQKKLAGAETKLTSCSLPMDLAEIKKQPSFQSAHRSSVRRRTRSNVQSELTTPIVNGFSLNTIYRGQAWIQTDERTYVVQPGDVIDGIRIERVEPITRRVITSRGVIR